MRVYTRDRKEGVSFLMYSVTGRGKTTSYNTIDGNLVLMNEEPKNPMFKVTKENMVVVEATSFTELMEFINSIIQNNGVLTSEILKQDLPILPMPIDVFGIDGLTMFQRMIRTQVEDARAAIFESETKKMLQLQEKFRMEWTDWGGLNSMMHRASIAINALTLHGIDVIATARAIEDSFGGLTLDLAGKDYLGSCTAYFDGVGVLVPSKTIYPPKIIFRPSPEYPLVKPPCKELDIEGGGILDWSAIFKIINTIRNRERRTIANIKG